MRDMNMIQEMSPSGRGVKILFLENESTRHRGQKGRSCERSHLSYAQATTFDLRIRGLQPLSVRKSRINNTVCLKKTSPTFLAVTLESIV